MRDIKRGVVSFRKSDTECVR